MSRFTTEIREFLEPLDPAPNAVDPPPGVRRRVLSHATQHQLASSGPPSRSWRVIVAAAALVTVVGAGVAVISLAGPGDQAEASIPGPYVFTIDEPAADRLGRLADRASSLPSASPDGVWYVRSAGWALQSEVSGRSTDSALAQVVTEAWITSAGRTEIVDEEGPAVEPGQVPQIGLDAAPGPEAAERVVETPNPTGADLADPAAAEAILGSIYRDAPEPYRYVGGALTVLGDRPLGGDQLSGIYRFLATVDGIRYRGTISDRAGRPAEAFTVRTDYHGLHTEYVLVVDADTGIYLGHEEVIIGDPGALDVTTPAVVSYRVRLEGAPVSDPGLRP